MIAFFRRLFRRRRQVNKSNETFEIDGRRYTFAITIELKTLPGEPAAKALDNLTAAVNGSTGTGPPIAENLYMTELAEQWKQHGEEWFEQIAAVIRPPGTKMTMAQSLAITNLSQLHELLEHLTK